MRRGETAYKEINEHLDAIRNELSKVDRSFLFTVCPKDDENINKYPTRVQISIDGDGWEEIIDQFYYGMCSLIHAMNARVPEELRKDWAESFVAFFLTVSEIDFPFMAAELMKGVKKDV